MQLACSLKSLGAIEPDEALRFVREAGYGFVELALSQEDLTSLAAGEEPPAEVFRLANRHELQVSGLVLAGELLQHSDARELIPAGLAVLRQWSVKVAILEVGAAEVETPQRTKLVKNLRFFGDAAAAGGQTLALETRAGVCGNSRSMAQFITDVDHPNVRLNLDLGTYQLLNPGANVEIALQRLIGLIAAVRLTDAEAQPPVPRLLPLGLGGEVDVAAVYQLLRNVAFAGPATLHFDPDWNTLSRKMEGPPNLEQCRQWLTDSTNLLRDCGWFDRH